MRVNRDVRIAGRIVNLTDETFRLYDNATGDILEFSPEERQLPKTPTYSMGEAPKVYYVVSREDFASINKSGRKIEDIAIVQVTCTGRGGVLVSFLVLAKDESVSVRYESS